MSYSHLTVCMRNAYNGTRPYHPHLCTVFTLLSHCALFPFVSRCALSFSSSIPSRFFSHTLCISASVWTLRTVWLDNPCDTGSGLVFLRVEVRFAAASPRLAPGACHGSCHRKSRLGIIQRQTFHTHKSSGIC